MRVFEASACPPVPPARLYRRDPREAIMTSVKIMPDRSIKYRYLSPNTLLVATGPAEGMQAGEQGSR